MKRTNIYLDEEQDRLLRHLSIEEGRSFTALVREALNEYLVRHGIESSSRATGPRHAISDKEWRERFEQALASIRSHVPRDIPPESIENDIDAAIREVRDTR